MITKNNRLNLKDIIYLTVLVMWFIFTIIKEEFKNVIESARVEEADVEEEKETEEKTSKKKKTKKTKN